MADRTTHIVYKTQPIAGMASHIIADGVTIGIGALVQFESGYLNHWDSSNKVLAGILVGGDDRLKDGVITGETSDTPPPGGRVQDGVTLMHVPVAGTVTQADVGALVYCADSDAANLTKTDPGKAPVGFLRYFRSTSDCDVQLFTTAEHMAGLATGAWLT